MSNIFTTKNILKVLSKAAGTLAVAFIGLLAVTHYQTIGKYGLIVSIPLAIILWLLAANIDTKEKLDAAEKKNTKQTENLTGLKQDNKNLKSTIRELENKVSMLEIVNRLYENITNRSRPNETLNQEDKNAIKEIQNHKNH